MNSGQQTHHKLSTEWRVFAVLMLAAAALLGYFNNVGAPARFSYDALMRVAPRIPVEDVVIVAIDDSSIAALGSWPWPRRHHARLLDILTEGGARSVGLDILLFEPGRNAAEREDDRLLAAALARNGRAVLPVALDHGTFGFRITGPLTMFADAAAGLGHTHFRFDEDSILRSVYLQEGPPASAQLQFAAAMHRIVDPQASAARVHAASRMDDGDADHVHSEPAYIPFAGPPGHFRMLPYHDVLSGRIAPAFFAGKHVVMGATAVGIANVVPTPFTSGERGMSGPEVHANILDALLHDRQLVKAPAWQTALFSLLCTLASLLMCRHLSPLRALICTALLAASVLLVAYLAFRMGIWLPPATTLALVLVIYPLWSWRRLEAALAFLGEEFTRLNRSTPIMLGDGQEPALRPESEFLDRRIAEMRLAAIRAGDLQRFIADSLDSMPDPALVLSPAGTVLMHNRAAKAYLRATGIADEGEVSAQTIFARIRPLHGEAGHVPAWPQLLLSAQADRDAVAIEARGPDGKAFLVKSAPCHGADGKTLGRIVSLVDVTSLREAERHRDETLHFLSHDMRSPQSSILALLELQKSPETAFPADEFYSRIERSVRTTLRLADDFVHLAKAKSATYHLQDADFPSMLADAVDDMWAYARNKDVTVVTDARVTDDWVSVDRPLMVRALGNLLSNAIKFSHAGGRVECSAAPVLHNGGKYIECRIRDEGSGISDTMRPQIFSPFPRRDKSGREGVGLGLAFVNMVVERHHGTIAFTSSPGLGTTFTIRIPCTTDFSGPAVGPEDSRAMQEQQELNNGN